MRREDRPFFYQGYQSMLLSVGLSVQEWTAARIEQQVKQDHSRVLHGRRLLVATASGRILQQHETYAVHMGMLTVYPIETHGAASDLDLGKLIRTVAPLAA